MDNDNGNGHNNENLPNVIDLKSRSSGSGGGFSGGMYITTAAHVRKAAAELYTRYRSQLLAQDHLKPQEISAATGLLQVLRATVADATLAEMQLKLEALETLARGKGA